MFKKEYVLKGLDRMHCRFTFNTGQELSGSLARHFHDEPDTFYLVPTGHMVEFAENRNKYEQTKDPMSYKKMKSLASKVNMDTLINAVIIAS